MFMRTFFAHHAMYRSRKITQYMEVPSREFNIFVTFACRLFQKLDDMPPTANCRKRKRNGQFIRNKCKNKRRRVSLAERETKAKNILKRVMKRNHQNGHLDAQSVVGETAEELWNWAF